jgi:hypothetical protein
VFLGGEVPTKFRFVLTVRNRERGRLKKGVTDREREGEKVREKWVG